MKKAIVALLLCALVVGSALGLPKSRREIILIDGHDTTIAQATASEISQDEIEDIVLEFADLIFSIVAALNEPKFDYWGNVQEEVEALVGAYINQHNMNQVALYQNDLETLLLRYLNAPVESISYPDKNQQAAALSMSIMSHRYLVMSGDLRFSLVLHFEDIASMHVAVLQDAAETYSTESSPSQWWVDLNEQLSLYINYSATIEQEMQTFRMGMIQCKIELNTCDWRDEGHDKKEICYDVYTVYDGVTGASSQCRQVAGAQDCVKHCQTYETHRQRELDAFNEAKVTYVRGVWRQLKEIAAGKARTASRFYMPARYV